GIKRAIREFGIDTVVLDDAFQQWGIDKDIDIVAIDANNPFGNRNMLPRGILREPLSALKRAGIFLITKCNFDPDISGLKDFLKNINPQAQIVVSIHKACGFVELTVKGTRELRGKKAVLVSGIADPDFFEKVVRSQSVTVLDHIKFDDHHNYSSEDADKIMSTVLSKGADTIITTEKDAVKLKDMFPAQTVVPVYSLKVELEITQNEEEFNRRLLRVCAG
ncbi:MAG: tetraacyldisaccharide 4'-kinase, partial [Candidatus Omnitrophica bacterium]|nr:tetraacyldisaccharide 4'-kinase [Candidatus Omnitrophota bacterium]